MDKELVAHIVELVKLELRNSADADVASSATGMLRLELVVHQCLMDGTTGSAGLGAAGGHRLPGAAGADSVHILDFCHAVEHLAAVCKLLYGQGTAQFDRQLKQWRARLRAGGAAVIDELERLRDAHGEHGDEIQGEINYLEANRERMNYPQYREEHLPIGSGTVESACKNVAAARMKGSGM